MKVPKAHPLTGLAPAFKALSDPTRLRLLNLLSEGEVCVCHLGEALRIVQPKVSRHLACLKKAGLVAARRDGLWIHYRWAEPSNAVVRDTMKALRRGLSSDAALTAERARLKKACCK